MSRVDQLLQTLRGYALRPCLEGDGAAYTYTELLDELERWRSRLDRLNIESGRVVALRADYSLSAMALLLALFVRCAIVVLIPRGRDATGYLQESCASALLDMDIDGSYRWQPVQSSATHPLVERVRSEKTAAVVVFTSGTTGAPKAALQDVERFLYKFCRAGRPFRTLAFLLFDHIAGLDTMFYTLASGGTLILTRRRDPKSITELVAASGVEVLPCSPSFLRLLCAASVGERSDLSSLKVITYGSEAMDTATLARLNERFHGVQIAQKYGTTETGAPRCVSRGNDSLWVRFKDDAVQTKVVDGILWIRSEGAMLGYLNGCSLVDDDGWYCTGDLVDVDGEWMRFCGRAADIINVGGEKVAPVEVEQVILELDFVRDVVVFGEPHSLLGQIVAARVKLTLSKSDTKQIIRFIRLHCRKRLPSYKVPIRIRIVDDGITDDRQKARRGPSSA